MEVKNGRICQNYIEPWGADVAGADVHKKVDSNFGKEAETMKLKNLIKSISLQLAICREYRTTEEKIESNVRVIDALLAEKKAAQKEINFLNPKLL